MYFFLAFALAQAAIAATVTYDWAMTWVEVAPDGIKRPAIGTPRANRFS